MAKLFRFWLKKIESQYRIRIGAELAEVVPWVAADQGFQTDCTGFLGPSGQFQISKAFPGNELIDQLATSLARSPAEPVESAKEWSRFARFAAMSWPVKISFEKSASRFAFGLPEEPRDLTILPSSGQIVVFAVNGVLELWKPAQWLAHVQATSAGIAEILSRASDELAER